MGYEQLKLDRQICFKVYSLNRAIHAAYAPFLKKLQLTYPQYLAMLVLWEVDNITVKTVCERLELDIGTVSPLLKRLEKLRLVERRRSEADERQVNVRLTPKGRSLEHQAQEIPDNIASCLLGGKTDADFLRDLSGQLDIAVRALKKPDCHDSRS
jgi:DNA-binding MarR family transcriptional regulator